MLLICQSFPEYTWMAPQTAPNRFFHAPPQNNGYRIPSSIINHIPVSIFQYPIMLGDQWLSKYCLVYHIYHPLDPQITCSTTASATYKLLESHGCRCSPFPHSSGCQHQRDSCNRASDTGLPPPKFLSAQLAGSSTLARNLHALWKKRISRSLKITNVQWKHVETSLPTPIWQRAYVNLLEGNVTIICEVWRNISFSDTFFVQ